MKKGKMIFVACLIAISMMIGTHASLLIAQPKTIERTEYSPVKSVKTAGLIGKDEMKVQKLEVPVKTIPTVSGIDVPIANSPDPEKHPAIAKVSGGDMIFGLYDSGTSIFDSDILFALSLDNGATWESVAGLTTEDAIEDYPALDYWGHDTTFFGTFKPDPVEGDGAQQYLIQVDDPTGDPSSWNITYWSWADSYPYRDRREPSIACYDGNNIDWWYGVMVCVGTRDERVDMPIFNYMNYADEGSGWSSYWDAWQGSAHATIDIDRSTGLFYAAVDWYNATTQTRDIVLMSSDCKDLESDDVYNISWVMGNAMDEETYPTVAAVNNYIYVIAQYDQMAIGQQDLVCYHSSNGGTTWERNMITTSPDNELYPSVAAYGDTATCTFTKNGNLYMTFTTDGGATWSEPEKINDNDGSVIAEYHNANIIQGGDVAWMDNRDGQSDIYYDNVGTPSALITITEVKGGFGVTATIENSGGVAGEQVPWSIIFDGSVFVGKEKTGTVDIAAGASTKIKTGLILGIGSVGVTITAGSATQSANGFVLGPLVLNLS